MPFNNSHITAKIEKLETFIPDLMTMARIPGLSISLVLGGENIWSQCFGIKAYGSANRITKNTVFDAGSLSKPMSAYAALKLIDSGKLELDTPLSEYLPEPYLPDEPLVNIITMRQVLSHTAGFPNWLTNFSSGVGVYVKQSAPLQFQPGERFSYSGEGFYYLQKVIEHLTDQSFDRFMHNNLLKPFGMHSSSYIWSAERTEITADSHDQRFKTRILDLRAIPNSAASLLTTAIDYACFLSKVIQPAPKNRFQLSEQVATKMLTPQVTIDKNISWGLGWGIQHDNNGHQSFWHHGRRGYARSFVMGFKDPPSGIVIMTNSETGENIYEDIVTEIYGGEHPVFEALKKNLSHQKQI